MQQSLTAIGSKQWGSWWDGRGLLRVKIYDFALYTNPRQLNALAPTLARRLKSDGGPNPLSPASTLPGLAPLSPPSNVSSFSVAAPQRRGTSSTSISQVNNATDAVPATESDLVAPTQQLTTTKSLRKRLRPRLPLRRRNRRSKAGSGAITDSVRAAATQVEMSLCVRPARDLPLMMLRSEYSRILRKRLKMVGGNTNDAALQTLLSYFNPEKLPEGSILPLPPCISASALCCIWVSNKMYHDATCSAVLRGVLVRSDECKHAICTRTRWSYKCFHNAVCCFVQGPRGEGASGRAPTWSSQGPRAVISLRLPMEPLWPRCRAPSFARLYSTCTSGRAPCARRPGTLQRKSMRAW